MNRRAPIGIDRRGDIEWFDAIPARHASGDGVPASYSASMSIGSAPLNVAIIGFIDPDGSPSTPDDTLEGGSPANPFDATPGQSYNGIDLTL